MPKPNIVLYAETLTHIRQLTLHASLQTEKNEHTKILLSSDKKIITALHDGESSSIYLPTQILGTAQVTFPIDKKTELSTRLQIDDVSQLATTEKEASSIDVPWSAASLQHNSSVSCGHCGACILPSGAGFTWKELPSENWAELMDFWFCHKPHDGPPDAESHAADAKGFSARSRVAASSGVGMVDTVSFLLYKDDCTNVEEMGISSNSNVHALQCESCKTQLGSYAADEESYRFYKSRIVVILEPGKAAERYPATVFLVAQLLSLIESSVSRKVVVHTKSARHEVNNEAGLLLWIFNPDIYYSSSKRGPVAYRAMKVFYKHLSDPTEVLDSNVLNYEELVVPTGDFEDFKQTIEQSTEILPDSARTFQDWSVGLLDRWERYATGSARMDENPLNKKVEEGFELFKLPAGMRELYL